MLNEWQYYDKLVLVIIMTKQPKKPRGPNLLQRFLDRRKNKDVVVKPNKITIFYDANLEKITGIPLEEAMISEDFAFADFLHSLFVSYPEIPRKVPPGRLGFLLNNAKPEVFDVLKDGDSVTLMAFEKGVELEKYQIGIIQHQTEEELLCLIKKYKINITIEEIKEIIFNEKDLKSVHSTNGLESDEERRVLNVLMKAWNYFPHKSLGGRCPIEKISELQKSSLYR